MILALNAGSSSLKFAVYEDAPELPRVLKGNLSGLRDAPRLSVTLANGRIAVDDRLADAPMNGAAALQRVFIELEAQAVTNQLTGVGHRIVHGGQAFTQPALIEQPTLDALQRLVPFAPLHQPFNLSLVNAAHEALPHLPQVACFDTAFHAGQPRLARLYGLPRALTDDGVLAYGFHGLSYAYVASVLRRRYGPRAGGRVIVAHLGSGSSLCALLDGHSIATTMGFSVLEGPPMSTRSGSLDPGVVLYLIQERGMAVEAVSDLLYERSGWLGISGLSADMSTLLVSDDVGAREAIDLFVYRVAREIGSLAAALGGLERLVFTAGIGEHAPAIRAQICERAAWLGVILEPWLNIRAEEVVSSSESRVEVLVIPTDEEQVIAEGWRAWHESRSRESAM